MGKKHASQYANFGWLQHIISLSHLSQTDDISQFRFTSLFTLILVSWIMNRFSGKILPCVNSAVYKRENPRSISTSGTSLKTAATYSPTICSTIGVTKLNFSVRNGKRWNLRAIATWISFSLSVSLFRFLRMNHKLKTQSVQNSFLFKAKRI